MKQVRWSGRALLVAAMCLGVGCGDDGSGGLAATAGFYGGDAGTGTTGTTGFATGTTGTSGFATGTTGTSGFATGTIGTTTGTTGTTGFTTGTTGTPGNTTGTGTTTTGPAFIRGEAPSASSVLKAGPYQVENITSGLRTPEAYGSQTLFYPSDAEPPFASIAIVPGFVSSEADIQEWGPFFASHGIVALTIGTVTPLDQPPTRADALLDALVTVRAENARAGGPLNGKLDESRQAVMGWSMGGGGALLAAERTPSLKAAVSMAGWNPGYNYGKVTVPSFLFAAQGDSIATGNQSEGFYDTLPNSTPKELWKAPGTGIGGGHYMFNTPHNLDGKVGRYGLSWIKLFLEGDDRYKQFLTEEPAGATDFRHNL